MTIINKALKECVRTGRDFVAANLAFFFACGKASLLIRNQHGGKWQGRIFCTWDACLVVQEYLQKYGIAGFPQSHLFWHCGVRAWECGKLSENDMAMLIKQGVSWLQIPELLSEKNAEKFPQMMEQIRSGKRLNFRSRRPVSSQRRNGSSCLFSGVMPPIYVPYGETDPDVWENILRAILAAALSAGQDIDEIIENARQKVIKSREALNGQ